MAGPTAPKGRGRWSFEQRLAWRIGMLLLLLGSLVMLSTLGACRALRIDLGVLGFGMFGVVWVPMIAALFSFAALVDSIVRRSPQFQFLLEIAIDMAIAVAGTLLLSGFIVSGR